MIRGYLAFVLLYVSDTSKSYSECIKPLFAPSPCPAPGLQLQESKNINYLTLSILLFCAQVPSTSSSTLGPLGLQPIHMGLEVVLR